MKSTMCRRDVHRLMSAYIDHEATPEEMRLVEEHTATCDECSARLQWLRRESHNLDVQLQSLLATAEVTTRRLNRDYRPPPQLMLIDSPAAHPFGRLATAAVVLVVVALVAVVLARSAPTGQPTIQTAAQPLAPPARALPDGRTVMIAIDGLVDPPTANYVHWAVTTAEAEHAGAVVLSLTPSAGLDRSMQDVTDDLNASAVPTFAYLPRGQTSSATRTLSEATSSVIEALPGGVEPLQMGLTDALWHRLLDPTTAYLFFVLGLYALFVEITHPGALVPGITGAVCLALAALAFSTLPTNWLGVMAVVMGVGLMGLELKAAKHGALVLMGVVCLGVGSAMLYAAPGTVTPVLNGVVVAPAVLVGVLIVGLAVGMLIARLARRIHRLPLLTGLEQLVGARGVARTRLEPEGVVHVQGQSWSARARGAPLAPGEAVRVLARRGLVLEVESATFRAAATQKGAYS